MARQDIIQFVEDIQNLPPENKMALRKGAINSGQSGPVSAAGLAGFFHCLPLGVSEEEEPYWLAVATWICAQPENLKKYRFGYALGKLNKNHDGDSDLIKHKLFMAGDALTDVSGDLLPMNVYHALRALWKEGIGVNMVLLLYDMLQSLRYDTISLKWIKDFLKVK